jgi:hypothetical protein
LGFVFFGFRLSAFVMGGGVGFGPVLSSYGIRWWVCAAVCGWCRLCFENCTVDASILFVVWPSF